VLSDLFAENGEQTLSALEQTDLITVISVNGRPSAIKPGRPVYHAAFKHLTEDQVLRNKLDLGILGQLIGKENGKVAKYETELQLLGNLKKYPTELNSRVQWVAQKLQDAQANLEKYERQSGALAKFLQTAE
jgi:RNA12 protein